MSNTEKTKSQIGKASRDKGKRFELTVAHIFQNAGFPDAHRTQQYNGRAAHGDAPDVSGVDGYPKPLSVECKANERLNLENAYRQSVESSDEEHIPCVVHKKNRGTILVTMSLSDFLTIYRPKDGDK